MDTTTAKIYYTSYDPVFPNHVINAEINLDLYYSLEDYISSTKFIKAKDLDLDETVFINVDHIIKIV